MTLREFLDAAYTTLVEEYQRLGMNLMEALAQLQEWASGVPLPSTNGKAEAMASTMSDLAQAQANDRALAELSKLMGGG